MTTASRTIFVVGFPPDWTVRETNNLFACADGFETACNSSDRQGQLTAFARFDTYQNAAAAVHKLNKRIVDHQCDPPRWLDCSLAQNDLSTETVMPLYVDPSTQPTKRRRTENVLAQSTPVATHTMAYSVDVSTPLQATATDFYAPSYYSGGKAASYFPSTDLENPPSPTMFIGKIPFGVTEQQLHPLFADLVGFKRLVFNTKCAFVEFLSTEWCTVALNTLKGKVVVAPGAPPLNVCYAKNKRSQF